MSVARDADELISTLFVHPQYACQCRGITPSLLYLGSMRREALKRRLEGYLRVREKIESSASVKEGRRRDVQRSLILHLPALMPEHVS